MTEYVFAKDIKVNSANGVQSLSFKANVPRAVPPVMEKAVITAGGFPADQLGSGRVPETDTTRANTEESIAEIVEAVQLILAEEDEKLLVASTGMPRANELEKVLGRSTTRKEREAAFAQLED